MARSFRFCRVDALVLILCGVLLVACLGAIDGTGRNRAKEVVCQANLRQWHAVFHQYLADNDGEFFTGTTPTGYWWPAQLDETTQSWKKNRTWFCPTATRPVVDSHGDVATRSSIFNAWGIFTMSRLGPDGIAGSYGLNGYTIDIPASSVYEGRLSAEYGWRDLMNLAKAETIPLFLDALRFDLWPLHPDAPAQNPNATWVGSSMARCCIDRHNGAVNCLFLDGSVRKVGLKELWTLRWHQAFDTEGPWTVTGGVMPSDWPEWMRGFKEY